MGDFPACGSFFQFSKTAGGGGSSLAISPAHSTRLKISFRRPLSERPITRQHCSGRIVTCFISLLVRRRFCHDHFCMRSAAEMFRSGVGRCRSRLSSAGISSRWGCPQSQEFLARSSGSTTGAFSTDSSEQEISKRQQFRQVGRLERVLRGVWVAWRSLRGFES